MHELEKSCPVLTHETVFCILKKLDKDLKKATTGSVRILGLDPVLWCIARILVNKETNEAVLDYTPSLHY